MRHGRTWRAGAARLIAMAALITPLAIPAGPALAQPAAAPGGPGALSHFDLARKDGLGTARNRTSKVWYTVAGGVLSDVYYPTVDNTNVETLQYVVTDGRTFTDLQTRDMTYTVRALDPGGMACQVTSTARSGRYRIVTDYLTDPDRATVLVHTRFQPLVGTGGDYRLYVRLDATVNGNGGGGADNAGADTGTVDLSTGHPVPVAIDTGTATIAANRDYATPVFAALRPSTPFTQVSSGFAGTASDGLVQLDRDRALTDRFTDAGGGNLVQTAQVDLARSRELTLALGFGATQAEAVATAGSSLRNPLARVLARYLAGWAAYDAKLRPPGRAFHGLPPARRLALTRSYHLSANVLKASEDKTFPGAVVASLASPWGQAVGAGNSTLTYFGSYREVFARDLYETFTGLLLDGDVATARDTVRFLFERQQLPDGSMPRNSLVNGKPAPDTFGTQLDEVTYPILMALQAGITDRTFYLAHVKRAADFAISHGPSFGAERWEEQSGFSPSTIAAEVAGLIAAARIADLAGDRASARVYRGVADDFQRSVKGWTITTNGPKSPRPYFIRLSKTGDPDAAITYNLGNGGPTLDQREVIDAGFLELTRLGLFPADDPDVARSLRVVDATIRSRTASGPGWHRYNGDGYGDGNADGHPWAPTNQGSGHLWPVLDGERAEHHIAVGDQATARGLAETMSRFAGGVGLIPEQDWENPDLAPSPFGTAPEVASIGFTNGQPVGSAAPLTWSAAQFVRLVRDLDARRPLERPAGTVDRYVAHRQGATTLTVTAPPDRTAVAGSPVTVTGTAAPGSTVDVSATNTERDSENTVTTTTAGPDGAWRVRVPVNGGTIVLDAVATAPDGGTAHTRRTVVLDFTPGTVLLDVSDPDGDDNGPGNYAYPTSSNFQPGAYDLQRFQVLDDGTNVIFRVRTRDLTPTFGSPLGAQLVDVYVHDPAASRTSTAASFPQRNYAIAGGSAWSRLLEVQGFGQRYVDATGATLGAITVRANEISRFITFSVPKSSLGQPGPGWGFTVVLTGQDGFSPDQARGFAPTPQEFLFGVCATASTDPHCTVDPSTVPKAMDVFTPPGVAQSDELDYILHQPVTLEAVTIP
ncbi:MAG TPA: glucodextranase DOMON-like domain-containing protein [Actinomycetota bacterium]|nr:glucodextranase DOMON-like domain-containing protein [Actinomycetota bacterium]